VHCVGFVSDFVTVYTCLFYCRATLMHSRAVERLTESVFCQTALIVMQEHIACSIQVQLEVTVR